MTIPSVVYILFLALVYLGWWALHGLDKARLAFLTLAGLAFFGAFNPLYVVLLVGSAAAEWTRMVWPLRMTRSAFSGMAILSAYALCQGMLGIVRPPARKKRW